MPRTRLRSGSRQLQQRAVLRIRQHLSPDNRRVAKIVAVQSRPRHRAAFQQCVIQILELTQPRIARITSIGRLLLSGFSIGEIDEAVTRKVGIDRDIEQAALSV